MITVARITTETATIALAVFAGRTVHRDEISTMITQQYAFANKRTGVSSYCKVFDAIERAGATYRYTGPNYTGDCLYTFPAMDLDADTVARLRARLVAA
ncbi:MAG: hypothetical protein ABFE07_00560 [Armatimonadia bacterium]